MRVAVIGPGGIGGYCAALLARGGADLAIVGRGAHLAAIRSSGLTLRSQLHGEITVQPPATDRPAEVGRVDLMLFCVKAYDLETAATACRPLVGPDTLVLPIENGIDITPRLDAALGGGQCVAGLTYVAGRIASPGVVVQHGRAKAMVCGEPAGGRSDRTERLAAFLNDHGLPVEVAVDMPRRLWEKFAVVCGTGGVLAVLRQPFGGVFADDGACDLLRGVMGEVAALARVHGVGLGPEDVERLFAYLRDSMPAEGRSSQLVDLEAGRPLELESLNGTALRLGRRVGLAMPLNAAIYRSLQPHARGAAAAAPATHGTSR